MPLRNERNIQAIIHWYRLRQNIQSREYPNIIYLNLNKIECSVENKYCLCINDNKKKIPLIYLINKAI